MTSQTNNVDYLVIGKSSSTTVTNILNMNGLADGEIRLFTPGGKCIDNSVVTIAAGMKFVVAVGGSDSKPRFVSEVIDGSKIQSIRSRAYTAATEQLDYIGYNGTSGSIEAIDDNEYFVSVYVEDYLRSSHDGRYNKHFNYISDSTAAQSEIALELAASGFRNFEKEVKNAGVPPILFKAICNDAAVDNIVDAGAEYTHFKFVRGSKYVTGTDSAGNATGTTLGTDEVETTFVAGDFLRVGATTVTTADVYRVVAVTAGTATTPLRIELDNPFRGATTVVAATATSWISAALGAAADWGVSMTGQTLGFSVGKEFYKKMRWTISPKEFGTTTITHSTAATEGSGVINQVKQTEWFLEGFKGETYRIGEPSIHTFVGVTDASVTGGGYDLTRIVYVDDSVVGFQAEVSPKILSIATPATAPAYMNDATTGNWDALEVIATTAKCTGVSDAGVVTAGDLNE